MICCNRGNENLEEVVNKPALLPFKDHIIQGLQEPLNDISSTFIRFGFQSFLYQPLLFVRSLLKKGHSVRYLIPDDVAQYIEEHHLYAPTPDAVPPQ